jgi:uroporphyrin-III C-methyltransferase
MTENDSEESAPALPPPAMGAPPSATPAAAQPRRGSGAFGWLLLLVIIAAAGFGYWRLRTIEQGHDQSTQTEQAQAQHVREQVEALQRSVDAAKHEAETLRSRLDDAAKVNESLRGQVLGLSERARLGEDAIANLADKRLSGHDALLLNEADLLLVLGAERYTLFNDPAPALAAYKLANNALAETNDAAFSTVRQSIAAEIEALTSLQSANMPAVQAQIAQLREKLPALPPALDRDPAGAAPAPSSRWWQVFGQFIRIRRDSDLQSQLTHNDPLLARALVDASLRDAQAALLLRDEAQFRAALARAGVQIRADFDAASSGVVQTQTALDELVQTPLALPAPQILGAALKELRNLRATRALHAEPTVPKAAPATPAAVEGQS